MILFSSLFVLTIEFSIIGSNGAVPRAGCSFSVPNLDPEPIVVTDKTYNFLYPEPNESAIYLNVGETIIISCSGGKLSLGSTSLGTTVSATCNSGTTFTVSGSSVDFNQITCSREPFHTARSTGNKCENNGSEIEIGFVLTDNSFAREILICFDERNLNALYSTYDLTRSIGRHDTGVDRITFIEDNFYGSNVKVNDLYERKGQRESINALLGLSSSSTKYIADSSDYYLARGHLTAKADFVYAPQQLATFHYVNVAPQWQTFNGGNWEVVESNVRDYADDNDLDLKVYTGTYGTATLPHEETGEEIPLSLYGGLLSVPELYWKVVYDPKSKLGVALLGLNNPYQTYVSKSVICKDISASINWLTWKPSNLKSGYSYACSVDDLRKSITYIPQLDVKGVLL